MQTHIAIPVSFGLRSICVWATPRRETREGMSTGTGVNTVAKGAMRDTERERGGGTERQTDRDRQRRGDNDRQTDRQRRGDSDRQRQTEKGRQ